jgi:hypothetical protein
VYEREQQLYETNRELRALSAEDLDRAENRRRVQTQAAAERANAQRLGALTGAGEWLIQQATRNEQFNVATLENWAEMLKSLNDIAANRMPSVADLLQQAATAPGGAAAQQPGQPQSGQAPQPPPQVGVNRDGRSAGGAESKSSEPGKVPAISDVESSFNELDDQQQPPQDPSQPSAGRLSLPSTLIQGGGQQPQNEDQPRPAAEKVDQAVQQQEDLLAEFAKVADELQKILNNLEGSTFVKRLKAASRRQLEVARDLSQTLRGSFGAVQDELDDHRRQQSEQIAKREVGHSDHVYVIQEDLEAYYNRVQQAKFKTVLNEMRDERVVSKLRRIADAVKDNLHGQSIAQAEFWSDALDRWAEQLVGPG